MQVHQALRGSPVKQAIGREGQAMVIVTRLEEGACEVSVIAGGSVFLQRQVPDEQTVEQVLWDQLHLRGIAFESVQTRSYTASPFRTKPESAKLARKPGWLALLFSLVMLLLRAIRVVGRQSRFEKKVHWWSPEQVLRWLYFLTRHMLEQQSLVFSVEDLQSIWLAGPFLRLYRWSLKLVVGASSGLIFGLGCAFFVYLSTGWLNTAVLFGVISGLLFSLLCGLLFRPGGGLRPEKTIIWKRKWSKGRILAVFLCCQLPMAFPIILIAGDVASGVPLVILILTICFGLLVGLSVVHFLPFGGENAFVDQDTTLHSPLLRIKMKSKYPSDRGLEKLLIKHNLSASTGEGVQQSETLSLLPWLFEALISGLFCGMFIGGLVDFFGQPFSSFGLWLCILPLLWLGAALPSIGIFVWLPACLSAGAAMVAQPLLLRLFLQLFNGLPWNLQSLLDQAVEGGLLRKVGGSYRPSPRLLLSYFDSQERPLPPHITVLQDPFTVSSFPTGPVRGQPTIITYDGLLLATARRLTMHWGHNDWKSTTDTAMRRSCDGTWQATLTVPPEATVLNLAFYDQSNTWDNRQHNDYHLLVREGFP